MDIVSIQRRLDIKRKNISREMIEKISEAIDRTLDDYDKEVIKEDKDLSELVGRESDFDVEKALQQLLLYFDNWQGNELTLMTNIGINDERVTKHLKVDIVQDRFSPILSVGIKNFPNETGYFMLWELSLSDVESDRRIIPIFVNESMVLRPVAGKRIADVLLDVNSKLTVKTVPNISTDDYSMLEQISMDYAYDTFVNMKSQYLQKNQESYNKYMYALQLRTEAAEQIGIENIKQSRLSRLRREKVAIEEKYKSGQQVYPDFRMVMLVRLEE